MSGSDTKSDKGTPAVRSFTSDGIETCWDLYRLGEQATELKYYFQEWRFKHMKIVSCVIGQKMGAGGSSGVGYLIKALDLHFFPELWSMRTQMEAGPAE